MNEENVKLFFYWINERERIRQARRAGKPWPWTEDPILQTYKFTNVFRRYDRTTQALIRRVSKFNSRANRLDLFTHICLFRLFNLSSTYDAIAPHWPNRKKMLKALNEAAKHGPLFTRAYITNPPNDGKKKHVSYLDTMKEICKSRVRIVKSIVKEKTLERAVKEMKAFHHIGGFVAYELACDFAYFSSLLKPAKDRLTWANTGPGAARGIRRVLYGSAKKRKGERIDYLKAMQDLLALAPKYLEPHVRKPLELREIEHSLCEYDKWSRVHFSEGKKKPKQKYKRRTK